MRCLFKILLIIPLISLNFNYNFLQVASAASQELISDYFTINDEYGKIILETGHLVQVGDEFISEDNEFYEVISVENNSAVAHKISATDAKVPARAVFDAQTLPPPPTLLKKSFIGIYHTHTDECYVPTDGKASSPGNGSILRVGDTLASSLRNLGYEVEHSTNLHDPHDANAYHRSRRTALSLMKNYPVALFDIHRDSAPLNTYQTVINGQTVARLLLVVGKQNQNRLTVQEFAQTIKVVADSAHPGLIRGIFIAKGNYNQDLHPRNMLVEIGTEFGSLEAAQVSAALLANMIPSVLALSDRGNNILKSSSLSPADESKQSLSKTSSWSYLAVVLLVVGISAGIYFYLRKKQIV